MKEKCIINGLDYVFFYLCLTKDLQQGEHSEVYMIVFNPLVTRRSILTG